MGVAAIPGAGHRHAVEDLAIHGDGVFEVVDPLQVRVGMPRGRQPEVVVVARPDLVVLRDAVAVGRKLCAEQVDVPRMKSQSDQLRVSVCSTVGLYLLAKSVVKLRLYLLRPNLTAVFASPVRL